MRQGAARNSYLGRNVTEFTSLQSRRGGWEQVANSYLCGNGARRSGRSTNSYLGRKRSAPHTAKVVLSRKRVALLRKRARRTRTNAESDLDDLPGETPNSYHYGKSTRKIAETRTKTEITRTNTEITRTNTEKRCLVGRAAYSGDRRLSESRNREGRCRGKEWESSNAVAARGRERSRYDGLRSERRRGCRAEGPPQRVAPVDVGRF